MTVQTGTWSEADLDRAVEELRAGEATWARTSLRDRVGLLAEVHAATGRQAAAWVEAACTYKQLDPASQLAAEEWLSGPYAVLSYLAALRQTVEALATGRDPLAKVRFGAAPGGRTRLRVTPADAYERLLLSGVTAEVWTPPGSTPQQVRDGVGLGQRHPDRTDGVGLVLGAGNITSIAPLDVLYQLFAHNRVALLKLNPVTDPMLPVLAEVFAPFIRRDLVRIVTGGADTGAYLTTHPGITAVHITGSAASHDAIVFGTGEQGAAARAAGKPRLDKPITSELGGVSPTIVLPGTWSAADLRYQAAHVATQKLQNGGFNCVASQILVVSAEWPQKDAFLAAVRSALAAAPARPLYYPGADSRVAESRRSHPDAVPLGPADERTLLTGLDAADTAESAFHTEYFAPVLGVVELPGDAAAVLEAAVHFANLELHGTLGANLIVDPGTARRLGPALDEAVARLQYGTVGVNAWTAVGYTTPRATWGAFPGHPLTDVQSGRGVVHNALLLDGVERSVVRAPFRPAPRSVLHGEASLLPVPPWFVNNRTALETTRRLTAFAANPRWSALPGITLSALRG